MCKSRYTNYEGRQGVNMIKMVYIEFLDTTMYDTSSSFRRSLAMFSILFFIGVCSTVQGELINDSTIKPTPNFNKTSDADIMKIELREKYGNINNNDVAKILFHRTLKERKEIENYYNEAYCGYAHIKKYNQEVYRCKFSDDLLKNSRDSMYQLYDCMFKTPHEILANAVHETIDNKSSDHAVIEETICARENDIKDLIAKYYIEVYKVKLEDHLKKYKSQNSAYQEAMLKFCWPNRSQDLKITEQVAADEAKALQQIDTDKDKEKFKNELKRLLEKYTEPDLKMIFQKYRKDEHGIHDAVKEAFDGDEEMVYGTLVKYIENTCGYYADALHHAVDDGFFKTNINRINRITVTRSERDMACIAKEYKKKHGETFTQRLKWDVIGSEPQYLECIRYLCGKP